LNPRLERLAKLKNPLYINVYINEQLHAYFSGNQQRGKLATWDLAQPSVTRLVARKYFGAPAGWGEGVRGGMK
jgi:hypothetical protein